MQNSVLFASLVFIQYDKQGFPVFFLLKLIKLNHSMGSIYMLGTVGGELYILKLQRLYRRSLGMGTYFHSMRSDRYDYFSMLGLKLNPVSLGKAAWSVGFNRYRIIRKYVKYDTSQELYILFALCCGLVMFWYFAKVIHNLPCFISGIGALTVRQVWRIWMNKPHVSQATGATFTNMV